MASTTRLNVRSEPNARGAILGQLDRGATVDILYRNAANNWWYVCCIAGTKTSGWVSNQFLRSNLDLAAARTALGVPAPGQVAAPQGTRLPPAAAPASSAVRTGGPTQLRAPSAAYGPNATYLTGEREAFSWQTDAPLLPGQVFELVFIPEGQGPDAGRATTAASPLFHASAPLPGPGRYTWGVWLAQAEPYLRLRYLSTGGTFVVSAFGGTVPRPTAPGPVGPAPREADPEPEDPPQPESPLY